jgi:hypothetical protein
VEREQLVGGVPAGEAEELGEVAEPPPGLERAGAGAVDLGRAPRRADEAAGDLDQRRLPGAVGPEQADELAVSDIEVDAGEGLDRPVALCEPPNGESGAHRRTGETNLT